MSQAVSMGALCQCSFGLCPTALTPSHSPTTKDAVGTLATIMDTAGCLPTFGMCTSPGNPAVKPPIIPMAPCSPVLPGPWVPGAPTVTLKGLPALTSDSKTFCAFGGVISIVFPGSPTVSVKG